MALDQIRVELLSYWGGDRECANAAWASTRDQDSLATRSDDDVRRLAVQLVGLGHTTPLERTWLEFYVTCPIFVERQMDKYRQTVQFQDFQVEFLGASFGRYGITQNELSGRYRTIPNRPYVAPDELAGICDRAADFGPRGKSLLAHAPDELTVTLANQYRLYGHWLSELKAAEIAGRITNAEYRRARELFRGVLGTAYMTDMRLVMNLNAFEHVLAQRLADDAQVECRAVAQGMLDAVVSAGVAPVVVGEMITKHGWVI